MIVKLLVRRMSKVNVFNAKVTKVSPLSDGKWIQTRKIDYVDVVGSPRVYEMAVRTTRTTLGIDAVAIMLILRGNGADKIVLVKQFRPPAASVMIEMPAGLVDPNETVETTAERELYEETGYKGKCVKLSPAMYSDPGLTNANMVLAQVEVDMTLEENKNPVQHLDEGEFIEVFEVEVGKLRPELDKLIDEGCTVDAKLYHYALGLELAGK